MKQRILFAFFTLVFISCQSNTQTKITTSDSTMVNTGGAATEPSANISSSGSTGTTGTGTVSDSGNAAHPGSDTMHQPKMDSSSH